MSFTKAWRSKKCGRWCGTASKAGAGVGAEAGAGVGAGAGWHPGLAKRSAAARGPLRKRTSGENDFLLPAPGLYPPIPRDLRANPSSCHAHKLACPRPFTLFIRFPPIPFVSRLLACLFCYFFPRRVRGGNSSLDISIADAVENRIKGFFSFFFLCKMDIALR